MASEAKETARVVLPAALRELAGDRPAIEVDEVPGTVATVLAVLREAWGAVYDRLMTEQGVLRPHVNIFVDGDNIRFTGGMETPVRGGSEVFVLPAISGG